MNDESFNPDWFSKPGDSLKSLMQRRDISAGALAQLLNGGAQTLRGILAGAIPIDHECAVIFARYVGGSSDFWLKRQAKYEEALERATQTAIAREMEEWLDRVPSPETKPKGKVDDARVHSEIRKRLAFFGVSNIRAWDDR